MGDNTIADVFPLTDRSFYVLGKKIGTTSVAIYDANRSLLGVLQVEVGVDMQDLRTAIRQAAPSANIEVQAVNGQLRLAGSAPDAATLARIVDIAQQYGSDNIINAVTVKGSQQVLLEVRFIEASRSAGRDLGVALLGRNGERGALTTGSFRFPEAGSDAGFTFGSVLPSGSTPFGTLLANILDAGVNVDILVQALESKGLARRLAEPNLVALSGQTASFLAGGEVPIPVADEDGKVTVEFKPYGVQLYFTPVVLDDGLINLRLKPVVSQVDPTVTIRTNNIEIPAFTQRSAETTVELRDGQSFAIAGLLQAVHTKSQSQIPFLGQLPILGALFRSSSFQKEETDLVIIVTPHLARPAAPGEPLRTPLDDKRPSNDAEFFLLGMLEVDQKMLRRFYHGEGMIGPFGHIIDLPSGDTSAHKK